MTSLPVAAVLPELLTALDSAPQVLLSAPTGAGKSTWLPLQFLAHKGIEGRIILLEPRRLAARNVAQRLAELLDEKPGETVGYRMRAQSCVGPATRLEVVTEGVLTRMIQCDPELSGVGLVILDEFHERSLQADLALALLLDVQQGLRDDLRLLIMSATLNNDRLQQCLPDAPVIVSEGRAFPVERRYQPLAPQLRFDEAVAVACAELLRKEPGSLLLFLPGVGEILRVQEQLSTRVGSDVLLCPLYGALSLSDQRKAILPAPQGMRKVVLATNIAETSLTIEGIRLVVDCAQERVARFDARTGLTRLITQRISHASMTQRAGRAGRLEPGICLHLIAKEQAERAAAQGEPEILHSDLSGLLMELLQWGCRDPAQLTWLDLPPAVNLQAAKRLLYLLGALDGEQLSVTGQKMAALGNDPRLAAMLVSASIPDDAATAAKLAAVLEEPPRMGNTDLGVAFSRHQPAREQRSRQLLKRLNVRNGEADASRIAPLLAQAFADRIARRRSLDGRYQLANGMGAAVDADDALGRHEWLIAPLLLQGSASPDARILLALPLDIDALIQRCPELLHQSDTIEWDEAQGTLKAWRRLRIGELTVKVQPLAKPSEEELHLAMLNGIRDKGLNVLNWTPAAEQLRLRLHCAAKWLPEYDWPAVDDRTLLETLENWLLPHMSGVHSLRGLKSLDVHQALSGLLDYSLQLRLVSSLPTHYTVPTGSRIAIRYHDDNPPALAVRMQEMFGEARTPTIAEGRVPLVLELLSPAQRPLQITQDLAAFWQGSYRDVQKEMKGRYPKHVWPDDPANTAPTRRTKKYS
ncbi:TPA: ATP-dependent helicase HrpB [Citrobacter farmeri]|uniref:ATP-dependent helicase HrpB n=1 Tax=Citrobacter farmeri TaxID=67824 RepID=UPI001C108648|nr:ATP-dependent helicase HrpB [Citrobacter farmeri]MBU5644590.1 ATP-dependent helicase HrpB [Pluralibacter sp. S54_ASV_43]QZE45752.1 ATP-dependent helicase HrpB [Citrobacter farmeri]HCB1597183.1 ATP-dependent helicase HrpB [Citrobacter farmeri]HCB1654816.1 ATP-dependent helicase HrpB [Citrobacter farmeri]HCB1659503.1 ATP-dependent helicase HrpB [Citrobacter farmeri]